MLKDKDRQDVLGIIDCEGFDYAFRHYSSFDKIKDKEFHKLRQAYVEAANKLEEYIGPEDDE